ncbi:hypothetical protein GOPIP_077_00050 [Gordonia polyisoprenivorans NBRC 16320 = JCM 10675]|uniref:Uncharacterized protein n=1 Tax=Gordonia polyisoprenivorans TaxID=84595 RepID=A0A846WJI1_9ACTN|nr:hypothetical protein [Gordonia polyisoprenivorans]NKY01855.1 hypothetical protein [Gordonia polyisoprenivorans]GAB25080.1 hypothetical protein GOPIP_077_00050 [Gordonia polyisoprenivorans NBRC 16320 = JCM 10675]
MYRDQLAKVQRVVAFAALATGFAIISLDTLVELRVHPAIALVKGYSRRLEVVVHDW